jgi:hypothetical protein
VNFPKLDATRRLGKCEAGTVEKARNECDHEEYGGETEEDNRPQDSCRRFIGEIQSSLRAVDSEDWNWLRSSNTMGNIDENALA